MTELKEGMYVRTKDGTISKIINMNGYHNTLDKYYYSESECGMTNDLFEEDIMGEPSFNIIDLIEVGDYVNGSKVVNINYDLNYDEDIVESITILDCSIEEKDILHNDDIKSIVTKEQFESMSFEVK